MWTRTNIQLPPEGVVVDTKTVDEGTNQARNEAKLMYKFNLWWTPDGQTYVYYQVTHWKLTTDWG